MERFKCVHGPDMEYFKQDGINRPIIVRKPSSGSPPVAYISGGQVGGSLYEYLFITDFNIALTVYVAYCTHQSHIIDSG